MEKDKNALLFGTPHVQDFACVEQVMPAWHPASWHPASGALASGTLVFNISSAPCQLGTPVSTAAPGTPDRAVFRPRANRQRLPERMPPGHVSRGLAARLVSVVG